MDPSQRAMTDVWPVVAAALLSSGLTVVGTFWLERFRNHHASQVARRDQLRAACGQINSHAISLALRSNALYLTTVLRSGTGEGLDVVLYRRKPIDPLELSSWLLPDWEGITQAQMTIELFVDAVIRAFPELFAEAGDSREATETATVNGAGGSQ
jgi:hypothetical protein